jgi:hypothetical protein
MIPFPRPEDLHIAAECCQSFVFDNGAFSAWRSGNPVTDWSQYYEWVGEWRRHPGFEWAVIPDVIDGGERDNNKLLDEWPFEECGVPVWHLHESIERLDWLANAYRVVALGSSGEWSEPGTAGWWERIQEALDHICDSHGRPPCKLHGLRMLNPAIFSGMPLASADSTNIAQNASRTADRIKGNIIVARELDALRIESHNSADAWVPRPKQRKLFLL